MGRKSEITVPNKYDANKSWTIIQMDSGAYLLQENLTTKKYIPSAEGQLAELPPKEAQWGNKARLSLEKIADITELKKAEIKVLLQKNQKRKKPYER